MSKEFSNEKKRNSSIWIPPRSEFIEPKFSSKFHVDGYVMPWQTAPPTPPPTTTTLTVLGPDGFAASKKNN